MSIYFAKNFKFTEVMCPCGCGKIRPLDPKLTYLLQSLRDRIKKPIYISRGGGLRCKYYNNCIQGYVYSPHLVGRAVDIHAKNMPIKDLAIIAKDIGFSRIGLYPFNHSIHVDTVRPYRNSSWVRDRKRAYHYFKILEEAIKFAESIRL